MHESNYQTITPEWRSFKRWISWGNDIKSTECISQNRLLNQKQNQLLHIIPANEHENNAFLFKVR